VSEGVSGELRALISHSLRSQLEYQQRRREARRARKRNKHAASSTTSSSTTAPATTHNSSGGDARWAWKKGAALDAWFANHKSYRLFYESYSSTSTTPCPVDSSAFPPQCDRAACQDAIALHDAPHDVASASREGRLGLILLGESTAYDIALLQLCTCGAVGLGAASTAGVNPLGQGKGKSQGQEHLGGEQMQQEPAEADDGRKREWRSYMERPGVWQQLVEAARRRFGKDPTACGV
jgi:hypothetical protein